MNEVNATFRRKNCGWIRSTVYTRFEMIRTYGHMRNHIILHGADFDMLDNQLFGSFCFFHLSPSPVRFIFEARDLLCCLRQVSRNKEPVKHSYDFAWHGIFKHTELQELAWQVRQSDEPFDSRSWSWHRMGQQACLWTHPLAQGVFHSHSDRRKNVWCLGVPTVLNEIWVDQIRSKVATLRYGHNYID